MDNTLSPEMQQQIRAYCEKVCAMHGLDDVREELQDHFEDKMLAYLSGDEMLQEQDAFLLVREHLGDAAELKSVFQAVHANETLVTLGRRLAAVAAATMAIATIGVAARLVASLLPRGLQVYFPVAIDETAFFVTNLAVAGASLVALYLVLRKWQRQVTSGLAPWFVQMSPPQIGIVLLAFLMVWGLRPSVDWRLTSGLTEHEIQLHSWGYMYLGAGILVATMHAALWIWWSNRNLRARWVKVCAVTSWLGFFMIHVVFASVVFSSLGHFEPDNDFFISEPRQARLAVLPPQVLPAAQATANPIRGRRVLKSSVLDERNSGIDSAKQREVRLVTLSSHSTALSEIDLIFASTTPQTFRQIRSLVPMGHRPAILVSMLLYGLLPLSMAILALGIARSALKVRTA